MWFSPSAGQSSGTREEQAQALNPRCCPATWAHLLAASLTLMANRVGSPSRMLNWTRRQLASFSSHATKFIVHKLRLDQYNPGHQGLKRGRAGIGGKTTAKGSPAQNVV
eukprot:1158878-Pelagomonas_calceolata.AAC.7